MLSLKTVTFILKRFYNLLYNPICGLLCPLSYWKNINSHSQTYNGYIAEDNKLKPLSCKVRNNMQTTLHVNGFKFHKPGK